MRALCRTCGYAFDAGTLGKPFCPHCGLDVVDVQDEPRVQSPDLGPQPPKPALHADPQRVHDDARDVTVELMCIDGHRWAEKIESPDDAPCPHGVADGKRAQVDLVCACGAALSVVGDVGTRICPRCGRRMVCPKCRASKRNERPIEARCPACGKPPADATQVPPVVIGGDVRKTIPGKTRH